MVKNPLANAGDAKVVGWTPGSGRSLGGGNGSLLQYTCLEISKGKRSLPGYSPWGHKESDTTEHASTIKGKTMRSCLASIPTMR